MAIRQARALYDFDAEPGTGEVSIRVGDILTITRTDVGEGWWEGKTPGGEAGLFPEAYVEEIPIEEVASGPPSMAPPPLPPDYGSGGGQDAWASPTPVQAQAPVTEDWDDPWNSNVQQQQQQQPAWNADDDWDSDFDDDMSPGPSGNGGVASGNYAGSTGHSLALPSAGANQTRGSVGDVSVVGRKTSAATSKASFNRFSVFVKSGSENYILGKVNFSVSEGEILEIIDQGDGKYCWQTTQPPYSCVIASPKKEAKFKGLKSYIAYQLTPSFNNIQVSRRYKHFDWLHERLNSKFNFIPVPPLPDKQIQGRYEEEFIEHRMNQLQSFVNRMCRHPVLSQSEVWNHFLTCTDEKRWKNGKRRAEKDPLVGGALYAAVRVPEKALDNDFVDREVQIFSQFSGLFDTAVKNMAKMAADQTTKCQNHYKREFSNIGKCFTGLGQAMEQDGGGYNPGLNNAVIATGACYEDIGKLYEEQPRLDWEHIADMMHDYKGLLSGWPQVLQIHSGATGKRKEIEQGAGDSGQTKKRSDTVSYALLAEVNSFHDQRVKDIKSSHQHFLQEQIKFYQKITERLQDTLRMYDQC